MGRKKKDNNQGPDINVFQLLMFRYYPYWPLFAISSIVMLFVAWIYLQLANPVYEATATLIIKDERKGVENAKMVESLNVYTSKKIVENEIEVLKSRSLLKETARILHLTSPISEEGLVFSYPAYTSSPVIVEVSNMDAMVEEERIEIFYNQKNQQVQFEGQQYPLDKWIDTPYGQIRFIKNPYLTKPSNKQLFVSFLDPQNVMEDLLDNTSILPSNKLSTVINLSFKDPNPVKAENVLNTLIESYNKASINDKNSLASNTLEFVESRIALMEHELDSLEHIIELYKTSEGIVDLSEQGKVFLKNVADNDQRLTELDMQIAALDRVEEYVVRKGSSEKLVPTTLGLDDGGLAALIKKLYDAEIEFARLKQTTAQNNPIILSLRDEIENMRPGILENIRNQKATLAASRVNLTSTNSRYAAMLESIPRKEKALLEANRQQAIKNSVYTFLLQKREETALAAGATEGDSRLVDKAEASFKPVAPKKLLTYAGALILGCLLAIAWVTKKEVLNDAILFRSEIEASTRIPIATEISDSMMKNYVVIDNLKKPYLTEQFTQLRAAVNSTTGSALKKIMVTSALAGEGKSFISTNFAISLAGSTKKILLIDMDLRNPRITHFFNVGRVPGVSDVLEGDVSIEKAIRRTTTQNLYVMGVGSKRTSATGKLLDGNLNGLFTQLQRWFDYIIVDTPPVTPVIDGYIISPYCDATLFVIRHGKTPKRILELLDEKSKIASLKNLAIVFNGIQQRGMIKNSFGYGYGEAYEYAYTEHKHAKKRIRW